MKYVCLFRHSKSHVFQLLKEYLFHWNVRHAPCPFRCGVPGCTRVFAFSKGLKGSCTEINQCFYLSAYCTC